MDGVLVHAERPLPGAEDFIRRLAAAGKGFLVLTNNSIYTPRDLSARLASSGIEVPVEALWTSAPRRPSSSTTSGPAAARTSSERPG